MFSRVVGNASLRFTIPAIIVAFSLLCCVILGTVSYLTAKSELATSIDRELAYVADVQHDELSNSLSGLSENVASIASTAAVVLHDLRIGFSDKDIPAIQQYFSPEGATPDERVAIMGDPKASIYAWKHSERHGTYAAYWRDLKLSDVIIVDESGLVLYTATKGKDFLTHVNTGPVGELKRLFDETMAAGMNASTLVTDFLPYPASEDNSMLVAHPIFPTSTNKDMPPLGIMVFRISAEKISANLATAAAKLPGTELSVLNEAGQVIASSSEGLRGKVIELDVDHMAATDNGNIVSGRIKNVPGYGPSLAAAGSFMVNGKRHFLVASRDMTSALAGIASMRTLLIIASLSALAVFCAIGIVFSRAITTPINVLTGDMKRLADGETDEANYNFHLKNEVGDMAAAVEVFRQNAIENKRLSEERRNSHVRREQRQQEIDALVADFREKSLAVLESVTGNSEQMQQAAVSLNEVAGRARVQASDVSQTTEEASGNLQVIAGAAEELAASVEEISRQVSETAQVVYKATEHTNTASERISGLAKAANEIGNIVNLISEIAEQTNLLALNATIEAARAGEAGKGFAVVASEVKSLATQTAKATESIAEQIKEIQSSTETAVEATQTIAATMQTVNEYTTSIATAVEQQGAATKEIHGNVANVAQGTLRVTSAMKDLSEGVSTTSTSADHVTGAARSVDDCAATLRQTVEDFLARVAAAQQAA